MGNAFIVHMAYQLKRVKDNFDIARLIQGSMKTNRPDPIIIIGKAEADVL
jgi:hypothetical protein